MWTCPEFTRCVIRVKCLHKVHVPQCGRLQTRCRIIGWKNSRWEPLRQRALVQNSEWAPCKGTWSPRIVIICAYSVEFPIAAWRKRSVRCAIGYKTVAEIFRSILHSKQHRYEQNLRELIGSWISVRWSLLVRTKHSRYMWWYDYQKSGRYPLPYLQFRIQGFRD